ncbi:hypothetical protein EYR40_010599 [Pleurotus pulmonarius]|nr:hypothetical protein EYR40_010599 [Pleurotus pulmonarius]
MNSPSQSFRRQRRRSTSRSLADIANQAKALVFRSESCVQADQIISLFDQLLAFNTALELIIERFGELERWAITTSFRALYVQPASISFPPEGNDRTNTAPSVVSGPAVTSRGIRVKRRRHRSDLASNPRYSFVLRCSNISYIIYSNRTCMTASDRKITNKLFNINKISIAD